MCFELSRKGRLLWPIPIQIRVKKMCIVCSEKVGPFGPTHIPIRVKNICFVCVQTAAQADSEQDDEG